MAAFQGHCLLFTEMQNMGASAQNAQVQGLDQNFLILVYKQ